MIPNQIKIDNFKIDEQTNFLEEAIETFGITKVSNFVEVGSYVLRWFAGVDKLNFVEYSYQASELERLFEEIKNDNS